jgi:glycine cleavage system H lipoate-binding protein
MEGEIGTSGDHGLRQDQLRDIVFVDLPSTGTTVYVQCRFGEIEVRKAVSELFSPVSGESPR